MNDNSFFMIFILLIFIGGILAGIEISISYMKPKVIEKNITKIITMNHTIEVNNTQYIDNYEPRFYKLLRNISERKYDIDHYNCINFSNDAFRVLKENGYKVWIVEGKLNTTNGTYWHHWIRFVIDIEPQTLGEINDNYTFYRTFREIY